LSQRDLQVFTAYVLVLYISVSAIVLSTKVGAKKHKMPFSGSLYKTKSRTSWTTIWYKNNHFWVPLFKW